MWGQQRLTLPGRARNEHWFRGQGLLRRRWSLRGKKQSVTREELLLRVRHAGVEDGDSLAVPWSCEPGPGALHLMVLKRVGYEVRSRSNPRKRTVLRPWIG